MTALEKTFIPTSALNLVLEKERGKQRRRKVHKNAGAPHLLFWLLLIWQPRSLLRLWYHPTVVKCMPKADAVMTVLLTGLSEICCQCSCPLKVLKLFRRVPRLPVFASPVLVAAMLALVVCTPWRLRIPLGRVPLVVRPLNGNMIGDVIHWL